MSLQEELQGPPPAKLVVDHVSKSFRQKRQTVQALDNVSLEVAEGEFMVIVGPGGCGKSTLLDIIAVLETRDQLYGDIQQIWQKRRKTIIFVTHNVREAACLADRVVIMSPTPGRIRETFEVDLPRPRDFNSIEIAQHASQLTAALKGYLAPEPVASVE